VRGWARHDLRDDFHRHDLQHTGEHGADVQFDDLLLLEVDDRLRLCDRRFLRGEPRLVGLRIAGELLLRDGGTAPSAVRHRASHDLNVSSAAAGP